MSKKTDELSKELDGLMWDEQNVSSAALESAFQEAQGSREFVSQWSDALDAKIIAVFSLASVLMGAVPTVGGIEEEGWNLVPWGVAATAWVVTIVLSSLAFAPRIFRVGPDPSVLIGEQWIGAGSTRERYYFFRLRDLAKDWVRNWDIVNTKARMLGLAIPFTAIETGALVIALALREV